MRDDLNKFLKERDDINDPFAYTDVSEQEAREYYSLFDKDLWGDISCYQILSEDFMREFKDKIEWGTVCANQQLSDNFIIEFKDRVEWDYICSYQKISEKVIDRCIEHINWEKIATYKKLDINFIKKYKKYLFKNEHIIELLLERQELPEDFIRKNKKLYSSTHFIDKIVRYQNISFEFKKILIRKSREKLMEFIKHR